MQVCRRGGNPNPTNCFGPCDLRAIVGRYANFGSPDNPAASYRRGQSVKIKYQRNNHGPGGFVRLSIIPPHRMMDKEIHEHNAFHYSCFGATPVKAAPAERKADRWGFSIAGNDGKDIAAGYYAINVTIPDVVPDGKYVLGWVWYGGTGGPVTNEPYKTEPWSKGYFSDYWSCSFVEVKGGAPLQSSYTPIFQNDMQAFSQKGCMSGNDAPEVCKYEPCLTTATYQKPRPFQEGKLPEQLSPSDFMGGSLPGNRLSPINADEATSQDNPFRKEKRISYLLKKRSCYCISAGERCKIGMANQTEGFCRRFTKAIDQPDICKDACCEYCTLAKSFSPSICDNEQVRQMCRM